MSLCSEEGEQVSLLGVLSEKTEGLLLCHTAHQAHQVRVLVLSHLLSLQDVLQEDLTIFVWCVICDYKEGNLNACMYITPTSSTYTYSSI